MITNESSESNPKTENTWKFDLLRQSWMHRRDSQTLLCFSDVIFSRFYWTSKIIWILPCEQIRITTYLPADPINKFYIDDNQQTNPTSDNGTIVPRYWRLLHTITTLKLSHGKNLDFPTSSLTPQSIFIPNCKQLIHGLREYVSLTLKQLLEKYLFAARSGIIHVYLPFQ